MEDLRELFMKYAQKGKFSNEHLLDKAKLKKLIIDAGYKSVKSSEVDTLFSEIDRNSSGYIDC